MGSVLNWITRGIIVGTFVGWIGWDVYTATHGGATESQIIADWSSKSVFFPFLIGFLCGHWFMRKRTLWHSAWGYALPIWGVLIAWDICYHFWPSQWQQIARYPLWWLLAGIPVGAYLWGQQDGNSIIP